MVARLKEVGREGGAERVGRGVVVLEYALLRCWIQWLRCREGVGGAAVRHACGKGLGGVLANVRGVAAFSICRQ